jgi:hypothetical protein
MLGFDASLFDLSKKAGLFRDIPFSLYDVWILWWAAGRYGLGQGQVFMCGTLSVYHVRWAFGRVYMALRVCCFLYTFSG